MQGDACNLPRICYLRNANIYGILLDTPFDEVDEMKDMLPSLMTVNIPRVTIPLKADLDILDMWDK